MKQSEENIALLYQYIDGDLTSQEALFVEQELARNKAWQDIYEGLVFAQEENIDVDASLKRLERRIKNPKAQQRAPIFSMPMQRYFAVAAAITGFLLLSFAALQVINSGFQPKAESAQHKSTRPGFYPEDQIQIIQPKNAPEVKQRFDAKKVEDFVADYDDSFVVNDQSGSVAKKEVGLSASVDFSTTKSGLEKENSYPTLLARYGYKEVRNPSLLNTVRGASVPDVPTNHYHKFQRNAMSTTQLEAFQNNQAKNYIARFPFNGIVEVAFVVDDLGKAKDFRIIKSPGDEASEVVKTLFTERANWQKPLDSDGRASSQKVTGTVSFGNTVFVELVFE